MAPDRDSSHDSNNFDDVSEYSDGGSLPPEASVYSDTTSGSIPSGTSEDREFVVSDTEEQSELLSEDEMLGRLERDTRHLSTRPIKIIAKRSVAGEYGPTIQFLVLWYSWEMAEKAMDRIGEMVSDLHID